MEEASPTEWDAGCVDGRLALAGGGIFGCIERYTDVDLLVSTSWRGESMNLSISIGFVSGLSLLMGFPFSSLSTHS